MAVATFDTLKFANTLKAAGVPAQQAEAQAAAFAEVIQLNLKDLVTKDDLNTTEKILRQEITAAEQRVKGELLLLRWMVGVNTAFLLAVMGLLGRLFFILPR